MTDGTPTPDDRPGNPASPPGFGPPASAPQPPQSPQIPQIPHQGGYGYPHQPQGGYGYPQQPQSGYAPSPFGSPAGPNAAEPDWAAMADSHEAQQRRKKRYRAIGIVAAVCVLGGGVTALALSTSGGDKSGGKTVADGTPSASAVRPSGTPSGKATDSPTVPGQSNLIADRSGQSNLAMSPDAVLNHVVDGYVLRLRSNANSYAEAADPLVDVSKSFSLSAWVLNEADGGDRTIFSQGDGTSFSFVLGRGVSGKDQFWSFKVQTGAGGADSTTYQVASKGVSTVNQWTLVTATYSAGAHQISLYVNGKSVGSTKVPALWSGPGPFEVGRDRHHGIWSDPYAGVISHMQVWHAALTPDDVVKLKNHQVGLSALPVSSWLVG